MTISYRVKSANQIVLRDVVPGAQPQTTLTIAAGAVVPTTGSHLIDTEAAAASDDLTTITLTNLRPGDVFELTPVSAARVTTVKHGTVNITTDNGEDIVLDALTKIVRFKVDAAGTGVVASLIGTALADPYAHKGSIDASTNPNYPAANAGNVYKISVAGKIGGASGPNVEVNDTLVCNVDGSAAGDHATVGANWSILQTNIDPSLYALLASPAFTGTPTAPTAAQSDNTTKIATTAYVDRTTREKLQANTTYYVDWVSGSNGNDGSTGSPWATITFAHNYIRDNIDVNGKTVTIQMQGGPDTVAVGEVLQGALTGQSADADYTVTGDSTTPANYAIALTGASGLCFSVQGARCKIQGFKVSSTGASGSGVVSWNGGTRVLLGNMTYGQCANAQIYAADGYIRSTAGYTIDTTLGASGRHVLAEVSPSQVDWDTVTATFVAGTHAYTEFLEAGEDCSISIHRVTFDTTTNSATVTGRKFKITNGGIITGNDVEGADLDNLPGSTAGIEQNRTDVFYRDDLTGNTYFMTIGMNGRFSNPGTNTKLAVVGPAGEVVATPRAETQLVIANNGDVGIQLLGNAANNSVIFFGTTGAGGNYKGAIQYSLASDFFSFDAASAQRMTLDGNYILNLTNAAGEYRVNNSRVVASRKTGWTAPTGTPSRAALSASETNAATIAAAVVALITDLGATSGHGLIDA